jgi:ribonuclease-3
VQNPDTQFESLERLEAALGLSFRDKSLLQRAIIHRSFVNESPEYPLMDNERLEFLGDAVIDFVTAELLYHRYPEMDEGQLTRLRAALVRTEALAGQARTLGLGEYLRLGRGEVSSGGRHRPNILCGAFEAVIGAIYLDQGIEPIRALLSSLFQPEADKVVESHSDRDAKSLLQESVQAELQLTPYYHTVRESGPDHAKEFTVEVTVGNQVIGRGRGRSKQTAEQSAARDALEGDHNLLKNLIHKLGEKEK